ncbi:hypothetical protein ABIA32_005322 [Streptacidiphilus sp. MAP12-20]|uniref:transcriptional regulator n=1 Tax=Streptacidiphilus sp. MAP12-20 TaxID=3156299 RepID=UPI0035195390
MADRTHDFGLYGADGEPGSLAAAKVLDALAGFFASPVTSKRGLTARLRYLTTSPSGPKAIQDAGITVRPRTLKAWLTGRQNPNKKNLGLIDEAYKALRRRNVARYLLGRLNARGGTRVELHPLDQSAVEVPRQRTLGFRTIKIRRWDEIVASWAEGDLTALDDAWVDQITDLGSDWGKYEYVTSIGFSA